ncbi:hypothetical protein N7451_004238 [Penicillium sp. IBT 35674x]|nr:hypothetical protein N7451_004238 [Penicillium sp. IBT 35674x]
MNVEGDFDFNSYSSAGGGISGIIETGFAPDVLNVIGDCHVNTYSSAGTDQDPEKSVREDLMLQSNKQLRLLVGQLGSMQKDAEDAYRQVLNLLDLKQKASSLAEARSTTRQGKAIMLFTIVTIIFLPLSFFTSYFGQNVSEITGDSSNPSSWDLWRVGMPISLVIIFGALGIAFLPARIYGMVFGNELEGASRRKILSNRLIL